MNNSKRLMAIAVSATLSGVAIAQTAAPGGGDRGTASPSITSPAGAGGTGPGGAATASPAAAATHELKTARLSKLDGVNIYDSGAKKIGEVKDLVLDPATGRVLHALVSIGGVLGVGDKEYDVPTKQLRVFSRAADDTVPIKVELGAAPDSLPPAKKMDKDSPYVLGSRLIGMDVNDGSGKEAGEIEDVVVDLQSGEAKYAMIEFEDSWGAKDKLFAFPMSELKRDKDGKEFVVQVTKESLSGKPSIEKARFDKVDLSGSSWLQAAGGGAASGSTGAAASASPGTSEAGTAATSPAGGSTPAGGAAGGASSGAASGAGTPRN